MIDDILNTLNVSAAENEGDYYKDNLLYCGICNEPKEQIDTVIDIQIKHKVLCKCGQEERAKKENYYKSLEREKEIAYAKSIAFAHSDMKNWNFTNDNNQNQELTKFAKKFVDEFDKMLDNGIGILFYGTTGTGKTFISSCIVNELINQGYSCIMTNFSRISNTIAGSYDGKQEYIDNLNKYDLLVIDDLGIERNTEYMQEIVFSVIDARYRLRKPIIITTNLTAKQLRATDDINKQRIYSRLYEMCMPFEVSGQDKRDNILKKNFKKVKELLGMGE